MRIEVSFSVELPETDRVPTDREITEWLRFCLGDNGSMKTVNPLSRFEVEPVGGTFHWH